MKVFTPLIIFALLSQLSAETVKKFGWKSNPTHSRGLTQFSKYPKKATPLPASASVESLMPPIYDQGDIGSCTANAGAAALDAKWKQQHGSFSFPSRLDLYQNSLKHDGNFPKDFGSYTSTVVWVLINKGVAQESKWKYVTNNLGINPPRTARAPWKTLKAYDVDNTDGGVSIKRAIVAKLPVMFGAYVYQQIFNVTKANPVIANPSGRPVGGHEMLIVGYDDSKQQYRIRNSWGTGWGDNGYSFISYSYIHNPRVTEDLAAIELTR